MVLGEKYAGWVETLHQTIRDYHARGVRLANTSPLIPELGLTGAGIQNRLFRQFGTTFSAEAEKILGPYRVEEIPFDTIKRVLMQYDRAGTPITNKTGKIPELGLTGGGLNARLTAKYGTTVARLRAELKA